MAEQSISWQALLGYLNFSEGRADPKFASQLNEAYRLAPGVPELRELLGRELANLRSAGSAAFQNASQAEAVLRLAFDELLPAYRAFHAELLQHLRDEDLWQPFFLVRAFEAILTQGPPWDHGERIVRAGLARLNDFVGYRPVPVLESRHRAEPDKSVNDHEKYRPIPLYIRGAAVAHGQCHDFVTGALEVIRSTDAQVLADAYFDLDMLDELAVDVRAYDHGHPANRRTNYVFGEWDPHRMDGQWRYRRFVVRQLPLDALMDWAAKSGDPAELMQEAAAGLAGIFLMASGVSGASATSHDSNVTLANLVPRIARCRDQFYGRMLERFAGAHGERLRQEAAETRQPFGGVRQHLNQHLARHRAAQQQQRFLAILFAEIGHAEASRQMAALVPTPSLRFTSEVLIRVRLGHLAADRGELARAVPLLSEVEELLRRGIDCGALVDPWNILGFQGLFPIFQSREDSVRDPRIDELIDLVDRLFNLNARLLAEAAAAGDAELRQGLKAQMGRLAEWWDPFAAGAVSGIRQVHGGESVEAAEHVAEALDQWRRQGEATAALAFWKQQSAAFQSPRAFALVVDALLRKQDHKAALALLMHWLSQADHVPLEESGYSFHALALRWLLAVTGSPQQDRDLVKRFFDHLESNADEYWNVPRLGGAAPAAAEPDDEEDDDEDNLYSAAYEGVTYRDTTDDGQEGAVVDDGPPEKEFDLESEGPELEKRLRFLSTAAGLWIVAAEQVVQRAPVGERGALARSWSLQARENRQRLMSLLDSLQARRPPEPLGTSESLIEYDRRRVLHGQLLELGIGTCVDTVLAVRAFHKVLAGVPEDEPPRQANAGAELLAISPTPESFAAQGEYEPALVDLEAALRQGEPADVRQALAEFLRHFRAEPLLFVPLAVGGHPAPMLRARLAQVALHRLLERLPRRGLLKETWQLLRAAKAMEQAQPIVGRKVTEFDHLFGVAFQGVVESLVESAPSWGEPARGDRPLVDLLNAVSQPFTKLWMDHSRALQLSTLEKVGGQRHWEELRKFIQKYGRDLFHPRSLTVGHLRAVLHRGVGEYLDFLRDHPDPERPVALIDDLDQPGARDQAIKRLDLVLRAVVENYEEYKDFATTAPQSAYGENLHLLLDFLRLKGTYERFAWRVRPLLLAHEVLVRKDRLGAAREWQQGLARLTQSLAEQHLKELGQLEQKHGIRLRTVRDRLEERFIKPLEIDRLCALVPPVMEEARQGQGGPALARLLEELRAQSAVPTGVGLDVPHWLRRLQEEVQRVRTERTAVASLARQQFEVPRTLLTLEDVKRQLAEWDKAE